MFTTGSKWFFGLSAVSFVLAAAYGWSTGGTDLGPVTSGYWRRRRRPPRLHAASSRSRVARLLLGLVAVATRDAETPGAGRAGRPRGRCRVVAPAHAAYWPPVAAFGAALSCWAS